MKKKNDLAYVPEINNDGAIDKFIIASMNGTETIQEIARQVITKFPNAFKDVRGASARVSKLAKKYSK